MTISVHVNGGSRAKAKIGIQRHILRQTEAEAVKVAKGTDSDIYPEYTHLNKVLLSGTMKRVREDVDDVNTRRRFEGKRAFRKDSNVFLTGTIQLSNDTLLALGMKRVDESEDEEVENYEWLPWSEQDEVVRKRIEVVYTDAFNSMSKQPDRYGKMVMASIHFDETSPHLDFVSLGVDRANIEMKARDLLNGPKGTPKGKKLAEMQDHLMDFSELRPEVIKAYGIERGESVKQKKANLKNVKHLQRELAKQQVELAEDKELFEAKREELNKREEIVQEREAQVEHQMTQLREFNHLNAEAPVKASDMVKSWRQTNDPRGRIQYREAYFEMNEEVKKQWSDTEFKSGTRVKDSDLSLTSVDENSIDFLFSKIDQMGLVRLIHLATQKVLERARTLVGLNSPNFKQQAKNEVSRMRDDYMPF